jgi:Mitochondrial carrier protein
MSDDFDGLSFPRVRVVHMAYRVWVAMSFRSQAERITRLRASTARAAACARCCEQANFARRCALPHPVCALAQPLATVTPLAAAPSARPPPARVQYMAAGAIAGIAEHVAMYPVDTVKTRMQALAHPGQQLHGAPLHLAIKNIVRREGVLRLYRGVSAVAWSAGYDARVATGHLSLHAHA